MEAPKLPSFIKQNSHRRFEFKPRYYNERKERLDEIKKKYEGVNPSKAITETMREKMQMKWREERKSSARNSNFRLVAIIGVLFLLTYLMLTY